MKKTLIAVSILAFFSIAFTACKKEKTKTVAERIVGTWQLTNIVYNQHTNGADHTVSSNDFTSSDTYQFTKEGTVYVNIQGQSDSSTYSITADNRLTIVDDETYDIKTLDDHALVLYIKTTSGSVYEEATVTFKR